MKISSNLKATLALVGTSAILTMALRNVVPDRIHMLIAAPLAPMGLLAFLATGGRHGWAGYYTVAALTLVLAIFVWWGIISTARWFWIEFGPKKS